MVAIDGARQIRPGSIPADRLVDEVWHKGDIAVALGDGTFARLPVGDTDGQVLTVDSTASTGLSWIVPGAAVHGLFTATYEGTY